MKTFSFYAVLTLCCVLAGALLHPATAFASVPDHAGTMLMFGTISLFETRTLLDIVSQLKRPQSFLLDMFFKATKTFDTENVDIDIYKGKRRMAPFVSPVQAGKVVERLGYSTNSYKPPYVKPKMVTTAQDILMRPAGTTIYPGGLSLAQRAAQQVGTDLATMDDMITRREEWMAAQALNAGTISVVGDGVNDVIDFQMAAGHKITLTNTALWTDTTNSNPLENLATWSRLAAQDSGIVPNIAVLGSSAAAALFTWLRVNDKSGGDISSIKVTLGQIAPQSLPNGANYLGFLRYNSLNLDLYTYDEWYVADADGVEYPHVPVDKVFLGSTNAQNTRLYGAIKDLKALAAMPRFAKSWEEEDPSARFLMLQSAPLIALNQPDAFVSAKVV
jgi:hypothetical protein